MLAFMKKYNNRDDGFTLIELLIVVLIIGILAAIAIPVYLGIQGQAHKSAVKADVNSQVKSVQVALTEGATLSSLDNTKTGGDKDKVYVITDSTSNSFQVIGTEDSTKGNSIDYTYKYDSKTGKFTESDTAYSPGGYDSGANTYTLTSDTFTFTRTGDNNQWYSAEFNYGFTKVYTNNGTAPTLVATSAWQLFNNYGFGGSNSYAFDAPDVYFYKADGTRITVIDQNYTNPVTLTQRYEPDGGGNFIALRLSSQGVRFPDDATYQDWRTNGGYVSVILSGKTYTFKG